VWVARALDAAGVPVHPETAITAGMLPSAGAATGRRRGRCELAPP
jgi:hypothetical protein